MLNRSSATCCSTTKKVLCSWRNDSLFWLILISYHSLTWMCCQQTGAIFSRLTSLPWLPSMWNNDLIGCLPWSLPLRRAGVLLTTPTAERQQDNTGQPQQQEYNEATTSCLNHSTGVDKQSSGPVDPSTLWRSHKRPSTTSWLITAMIDQHGRPCMQSSVIAVITSPTRTILNTVLCMRLHLSSPTNDIIDKACTSYTVCL